jgi:hypothetical protein
VVRSILVVPAALELAERTALAEVPGMGWAATPENPRGELIRWGQGSGLFRMRACMQTFSLGALGQKPLGEI